MLAKINKTKCELGYKYTFHIIISQYEYDFILYDI